MPLSFDTVDIAVEQRGAVLWLTFDRPETLNAISPRMSRELLETFTALREETSVRVVVLRGAGRGFCSGLDINLAGDRSDERVHLPLVIRAMRECPQPIIAAVNGPAFGGGFAFALASDVRIAGPDARMSNAFVRMGVSGCEMGVTYFLPRQVGLSIASELMLTGRPVDAERALRIGLVSDLVPADELERTVAALAAEMLRVAPLALQRTKEVLGRIQGVGDLVAAMAIEDATQRECLQGDDFDEAIAAFQQKREPEFGGSR